MTHPQAMVRNLKRARTALDAIMRDEALAERARMCAMMLGIELCNTGNVGKATGQAIYQDDTGWWSCPELDKLLQFAGHLQLTPPVARAPDASSGLGVPPWEK